VNARTHQKIPIPDIARERLVAWTS
jgi:hypothetical protein